MKHTVYHLEHVQHVYGDKTVLSIDYLEIERHSIIGIVGPNGSGKSTLLRLLGFVESPTKGQIHYFSETGQPRFEVTLLTQEPYLLKRDVFDNVSYGLRVRGVKGRNVRRLVEEALEWVALDPAVFLKRRWYELSGGEAQRVALATRLVLRPKVLLLDEPTANVDIESARRIREATLWARSEWGTTVLVSSHDRSWLFNLCDTMIHIFRGRVVGSGIENIIFGPWRYQSDSIWEKALNDGQSFICSDVPGESAVGLVHLDAVRIFPLGHEGGEIEASNNGIVRLKGMVSQVILVGTKGDIVATVLAGGEAFTARLSQNDPVVMPGREVTVFIDTTKIQWL